MTFKNETVHDAYAFREGLEKGLEQTEKYLARFIPEPEPKPPEPEPEPTEPRIPAEQWLSHAAIIAQTGRGKTNAIRWRIAQLLPDLKAGRASLILMEPKGTLTESVLRWTELPRERTVVIDPDRPLTVNLFDKGDGSPQALRDALSLSTYVLSTMTAGLSSFQETALTYPLRLLFATAHPTIDGLISILRNGGKSHPAIHRMPPRIQEYFHADFERSLPSRNQLLDRFNGLLADPVFEELFSGVTTFDFLGAMERGSIIVIDADERKLGKATELYGRFWLAQAYKAAMARLGKTTIPATFIIDEAQTFIREDEMLATILDKAREARMGMILAFHHMEQISAGRVRDSIYTNTALKFAARTSADIFNLCRSMGGTEPSFIQTLTNYEFAFYSPSLIDAIKVKLPPMNFLQGERFQMPQAELSVESEPDPEPQQPEVQSDRKPEQPTRRRYNPPL